MCLSPPMVDDDRSGFPRIHGEEAVEVSDRSRVGGVLRYWFKIKSLACLCHSEVCAGIPEACCNVLDEARSAHERLIIKRFPIKVIRLQRALTISEMRHGIL